MTTKPLAFQPAPRPQPRASAEQARELAEATRELGFGRTTSAPEAAAAEPLSPTTAIPAAPAPQVRARGPARPVKGATTAVTVGGTKERMASLKVEMPDDIWTALRHEALNRRVTVKYLVMEALAAKGYDIDLTKVAEDGRRVR